ncbi:MAG: aminomethyl-transferring glycine dehydrogenase subunit GcvPA [Muribaculaceae bacterium]|nr:aminomethyl-transferring glycine dehydrogenase subunit GcvPA [Muribaculaceae bacterium]MDE6360101.1 aminomethyl-transferring glycine dehydrogenase subunit GcvPA [Muribaculaceae bacterium]
MHRYFPHTPADIKEMLDRCGVSSLDDLYGDVDSSLRLKQPYNLPQGMDETAVRRYFDHLAKKNVTIDVCFAGGGFYDHGCPAAVKSIASRSEFLTAYTPYQPEISQGTLQYIFEYQTMMSRLTGMDISNASMYDGATATAEAVLMAVASQRKRNLVLVSATLSPDVRRVVDTYANYHGVELATIPAEDGETSRAELARMLDERGKEVAGVVVPSPNYYGIIENHEGLADLCHSHKALLIVNCVASTLAVLKTPGELGADIACGDAQSLGIPLSFGGPYLGFLCATKALMRKMPGRIVGATTDSEGRRCFVLTLQAREQHIRREKATSNICSNQGLMTLWVSAYMSLVGAGGLREINEASSLMARYLLEKMTSDGRARLRYPSKPFLNEFLLETDYSVDSLIAAAIRKGGILPGIKVDDHTILMAATEMQTRHDADHLFEIAKTCV